MIGAACVWENESLMIILLVHMNVSYSMYAFAAGQAIRVLASMPFIPYVMFGVKSVPTGASSRTMVLLRKFVSLAIIIAANIVLLSNEQFLYHEQGSQVVHSDREVELSLFFILLGIAQAIARCDFAEEAATHHHDQTASAIIGHYAILLLLLVLRQDLGLLCFKFALDISMVIAAVSLVAWLVAALLTSKNKTA